MKYGRFDDREAYWARCEQEAKRIMQRFDITSPRCGFSIGLGWMKIVEHAFEKMVAAGWDRDLHQVKQKFCGLRIYIGNTDDRINAIIDEAVLECYKTCELCGLEREDTGIKLGLASCRSCGER